LTDVKIKAVVSLSEFPNAESITQIEGPKVITEGLGQFPLLFLTSSHETTMPENKSNLGINDFAFVYLYTEIILIINN
jgi:hypothetical protein